MANSLLQDNTNYEIANNKNTRQFDTELLKTVLDSSSSSSISSSSSTTSSSSSISSSSSSTTISTSGGSSSWSGGSSTNWSGGSSSGGTGITEWKFDFFLMEYQIQIQQALDLGFQTNQIQGFGEGIYGFSESNWKGEKVLYKSDFTVTIVDGQNPFQYRAIRSFQIPKGWQLTVTQHYDPTKFPGRTDFMKKIVFGQIKSTFDIKHLNIAMKNLNLDFKLTKTTDSHVIDRISILKKCLESLKKEHLILTEAYNLYLLKKEERNALYAKRDSQVKVVDELNVQIQTLEKQISEKEKFIVDMTESVDTEKKIENYRIQITRLREEIKTLTIQKEKIVIIRQTLESEIKSLEQQIETLTSKITTIETKITETGTKITTEEHQVTIIETNATEINEQIRKIDEEIKTHKNEKSQYLAEIEVLKQKIQVSETEITRKEEERRKKSREYTEIITKKTYTSTKIEEWKKEIVTYKSNKQEIEHEIKKIRRTYYAKKGNLQTYISQIENYTSQIRTIESQISDISITISNLSHKVTSKYTQEQITAERRKLAELKEKLLYVKKKYEEESSALTIIKEQLTVKIEEKRKAKSDWKGKLQIFKSNLKACEKRGEELNKALGGQCEQIIHSLFGLVKTNISYEKFMESVTTRLVYLGSSVSTGGNKEFRRVQKKVMKKLKMI